MATWPSTSGPRRSRAPTASRTRSPSTWTTSRTSAAAIGAALLFVRWAPSRRPPGRSRGNAGAHLGCDARRGQRPARGLVALRREGRPSTRRSPPLPRGLVSRAGHGPRSAMARPYRVVAGDDELRAVLRGKMKRDTPKVVAGDVVTLEPEAGGDLWGITEVEPRRSVLERRIPGRAWHPCHRRQHRSHLRRERVARPRADPVRHRPTAGARRGERRHTAPSCVNKIDLDPGTERHRPLSRRPATTSSRSAPSRGLGLEAIRGLAARTRLGVHRPERRRKVEPPQRRSSRAWPSAPGPSARGSAAARTPR